MIYVYTNEETGHSVERSYPSDSFPRKIKVNGKWYHKDIAATHSGRAQVDNACWPMASDACGVNPDQIADAIKADQKLGVKADYDSMGRVIWTSAKHRKVWCEAHEYYDRNGGYTSARRFEHDPEKHR